MLQFIANSCPIAALRRRSSQRVPKSDGWEKKFATQFTLVGQYCLVVGTYNPRTALLRLTVREALFSSLLLFPSLLASPLLFRSLPRRQKEEGDEPKTIHLKNILTCGANQKARMKTGPRYRSRTLFQRKKTTKKENKSRK